jgi:predicted  nucleic acid-binding Zn-ribbon protein
MFKGFLSLCVEMEQAYNYLKSEYKKQSDEVNKMLEEEKTIKRRMLEDKLRLEELKVTIRGKYRILPKLQNQCEIAEENMNAEKRRQEYRDEFIRNR